MELANEGVMSGNSPNIDSFKHLLPANVGANADASHREFLRRLRQVQAYPQSTSGDVEVSGAFTGIWKKDGVPEFQVTAPLNVWDGSKHWTIKPHVQHLLPANVGANADASHREFLRRLRQVQAYPQSTSGDVEVSGAFTGIWKKVGVPEFQVTAPLNVWDGSKHWTIKPHVQVLLRSEELKVSSKTAFLAVVKVATAGEGAILAERLILLSDEGAAIHVNGIKHASSLLVTIEPFSGGTDDLLKASFLVRSSATADAVASISEKQRAYDGMLIDLSLKISSANVVDDVQEMQAKLTGLQNAAADLNGKTDRMQMAIDVAHNDHHDLGKRVEMHGEQLKELRGGLAAAGSEATITKLTVSNCELAVEASKGRIEELAAENRRLVDATKALQDLAELQDQHITELRGITSRHETALGRFKLLAYAMIAAFVAFVSLLFVY
ncbi:hypothetical protein AAVH_06581 [Aphelenchoides avenae]|nr:hypothetical protein AAVH_06581 [Aphelenchus avenae]